MDETTRERRGKLAQNGKNRRRNFRLAQAEEPGNGAQGETKALPNAEKKDKPALIPALLLILPEKFSKIYEKRHYQNGLNRDIITLTTGITPWGVNLG